MELPEKFIGWLTINRMCNLRCGWCYAKATGFSSKDNMELTLAEKCIDVYENLPMDKVILLGGEPTIYPHVVSLIGLIKNKGLEPYLLTNSLWLADIEFAKKIQKAGIQSVNTSLKAGTKEQYIDFTGVDALGSVERAFQNMNELGIDHKVSVTICKGLLEGFELVIDVLKRNDVQYLSIEFERPVICKNGASTEGMASNDELVDFCIRMYPKLVSSGLNFSIRFSLPFCLFPEDFLQIVIQEDNITSGCQIYNGVGVIFDPKGRLLPCGHFCNNPIGQIDVDFSTAEEYLEFRQRDVVKKLYNSFYFCPDRKCVDCRYWSVCGAGCRVRWMKGVSSKDLIGNFRQRKDIVPKGGDLK